MSLQDNNDELENAQKDAFASKRSHTRAVKNTNNTVNSSGYSQPSQYNVQTKGQETVYQSVEAQHNNSEQRVGYQHSQPVQQSQQPVQESNNNNKSIYVGIGVGALVAIMAFMAFSGGKKSGTDTSNIPKTKTTTQTSQPTTVIVKTDPGKEAELRRKEEELRRREAEVKLREEQIRKKDQEIVRVNQQFSNNVSKRQAANFLISYFKDIDNKDFNRAWRKLSQNERNTNFADFNGYRSGFDNTYSQDVRIKGVDIVSGNRATVYFDLYAKDRENGRLVPHNFTGRWDVVKIGSSYYLDNPSVKVM